MGMVLISLVAFLLLPALLIYSLIKPAKLNIRTKRNPNGKWSRGKFALGIMGAWVAAIAIGVAITPEQSTTIDIDEVASEAGLSENDYEVDENGAIEVKAAAADVPEVVEAEPVKATVTPEAVDKTFGITPVEFSHRFSIEAEEVGFDNKVPYGDFETMKGAVNDVFTVILSDAIAMNGTVDKNGELKGITFLMGKTEKGDIEGLNMIILAGLSARAISPELPKEETAGTVMEIMSEAAEGFSETGEGESSKVVGDVKYTAIASQAMGIWIVLEPV